MIHKRMSDEELAEEARRWDDRETSPRDWKDAPEAVPRAKQSVAISIRLPTQLVELLKRFAAKHGTGYQVLIKRWLDDRLKEEHKRLRENMALRATTIKLVSPNFCSRAAAFSASGDAAQFLNVAPATVSKAS